MAGAARWSRRRFQAGRAGRPGVPARRQYAPDRGLRRRRRGSGTAAQVQIGQDRPRHVSDPASDRGIAPHPGHDCRRSQCQHGRNRMIPARAHPAIRYPGEKFQQVTAGIRYWDRHDRLCRCGRVSINDRLTHDEAPVAGICERIPVPTGASSPSPARHAAHDHIATLATNRDSNPKRSWNGRGMRRSDSSTSESTNRRIASACSLYSSASASAALASSRSFLAVAARTSNSADICSTSCADTRIVFDNTSRRCSSVPSEVASLLQDLESRWLRQATTSVATIERTVTRGTAPGDDHGVSTTS